MPQIARPDSTIDNPGSWVAVGAATLHETIDEPRPSDNSDYNESVLSPSNANFEIGLSDLVDPLTNAGHICRYTLFKDVSAGRRMDAVVRLLQGVTIIHSETHTDIPSTPTDFSFTLSPVEADSITDYTDLRQEVEANEVP